MSSRTRGQVSRRTLASLSIAAALAGLLALGALGASSALAHPRTAARACARRAGCRSMRRAREASGRRLARERRRLERLERRRARAQDGQAQATSPAPAPTQAAAASATAEAAFTPPPAPATPPAAGQLGGEDPNFRPGLVSGTNMKEDLHGAVLLGAKLVRVGFSIASTVAELEPVIGGYAAEGIRVQPLAEFYGRMPSAGEAQNLAGWARAFGPGGSFWRSHPEDQQPIDTIEFGNETDSGAQYDLHAGEPAYTSLAETYATRLREAAQAVAGTGADVGLLAEDDDETGDWMRGMYAAVPNLTQYVSGWTIHPYGGEQYNRERLALLLSQTAEHGASALPIDITEWGVSTDNGDCVTFNEGLNPCMSYEEAAQELRNTVAWIEGMLGERLGDFFLYQVRDQQPAGASSNWQAYFGVLQHELQPKGAYTEAARELLDA